MARLPREQPAPPPSGTPILVWIVYAVGILAAAVFVISVLFVVGAYIASDDVPVTYDVSVPAIVLWGALVTLAIGTWLWRRRAR